MSSSDTTSKPDNFRLSAPDFSASGIETQMNRQVLREEMFGHKHRPTEIGRYVVESKLGEGGMGVVYRAWDDKLQRSVAIKLLGRTGDSGRLTQEAQAMARLAHPNVVQVYEVGEHEQQVFIAMELVEGQTLREWFESLGKGVLRRRQWPAIVEMMLQAGAGLLAAHQAKLVHRDFKPDNVLVAEDGRARVLDFGLAEPVAEQAPERQTDVGALEPNVATFDAQGKRARIAGTPAYLAAEILAHGTYDARSDQFSFCVTMFEGVYGQRPFQGASRPELMFNLAEGRISPPPPGARIPRWLNRVIRRGLDPDPQRRWSSMDELMEACHRGLAWRRRLPWLGGTAALVLIFVVYSFSGRQVCVGVGEPIANVWTADAQQNLRQALVASGAAFTEPLAKRVHKTFKSQVEDWAEAAEQTCEAHSAGHVPDGSYTLQRACLFRHRDRIAELLSVLTKGGDQTAPEALQAVLKLESVRECEDVEHLLERSERLKKPSQANAEEVAAAETKLQRVRALHDAHLVKGGLKLARELEVEVKKIGYAPLSAEVGLWLGRLLVLEGSNAEAEQVFLAAVFLAEQANHDQVKVAALAELTKVMGTALSRHQEAIRWSQLAESTLERRNEKQAMHRSQLAESTIERRNEKQDIAWADLLNSRAAVEANRGHYQAAHGAYKQALVIVEEFYGQEDLEFSKMLSNYATSLEDLGRFDEALKDYNRALKIASDTLGDQHPALAVILNNIGALERKRRKLPDSQKHLAQAERILANAGQRQTDRYGQVLNNFGTLFEDLNQLDSALDSYTRAAELLRKTRPNDFSVGMIEMNIGNILRQQQDFSGAIARHKAAIAFLGSLQDEDTSATALAYLNLGEAQIDAGDFTAAERTLGRSLTIATAVNANDSVSQADVLVSLGRLAIKRGDCATAVLHLKAAQTSYKQGSYDRDVATADLLLAHALVASKHPEEQGEARILLAKALAKLPPETPGVKAGQALLMHLGEGSPSKVTCGEFLPSGS